MHRKNFYGRKEQRREDGVKRDADRASLSLEARLLLCDERPGESKRERARLQRQIAERVVVKPEKKKKEPARQDKKALKARKKKEENDTLHQTTD